MIRNIIAAGFVLGLLGGCTQEGEPSDGRATPSADKPAQAGSNDVSATPSGDDAGEWLLHGLSVGEQRYSPLDDINAQTVDRLGLAFEYDGFTVRGRTHRGVQATALMDDGVLYFTGPWSVVYAIDARTGEELWVHDPEADGARARVTCCDVVNRGAALHDDRLIVATLDGYLQALDKTDGSVIWRADTFVNREGAYAITGAPRLAGDVVVIGNSGGEMGVRGYVSAYDIESGELAWRFYTVPGEGPDESIDVTRARETWSEDMPWEFGGGGTAWDSMVYDPALDTIYIGVGNGSPWPVWKRGDDAKRDNLYLSSIVAVDAETGLAKWHYQTTPGDSWDYTATQHMILADMDWKGELRKVIMQAPKNGFFYVLDRETGELLSADNYVPVSWAKGVDLETGRPMFTENSDYSEEARLITPAPGGGHNWPPMAYNPNTGLVYIPTLELSTTYSTYDDGEGYKRHSRNTQALATVEIPKLDDDAIEQGLPPRRLHAQLTAWDPIAGSVRWKSAAQPYWTGGALTTAGNLVISGSSDGFLNFFDAETGDLLRAIEIGTAISAPPMTYELDGEQYVAVLAGLGGVVLRTWLPSFASVKYQNYERALVFKLDGGEVTLPPPTEPPVKNAIPSGLPTDDATIALGEKKFNRHCVVCHTPRNVPGGMPNLWNLHEGVDAAFDQIVLEGAMEYAGMANFSDVLTPEDTLAIRAYLAHDRRLVDEGAVVGALDAH